MKPIRLAAAVVALAITPFSAKADSADPADNTQAGATTLVAPSATVITVGPRDLSVADPADYYRIFLTAGNSYFFDFPNTDTTLSAPDHPHLTITKPSGGFATDAFGSSIDFDHVDSGTGVTVTASETGTYFILVEPFTPSQSVQFTYFLSYQDTTTGGGTGTGTTPPVVTPTVNPDLPVVTISSQAPAGSGSTTMNVTGTAVSPNAIATIQNVAYRVRNGLDPWGSWKTASIVDKSDPSNVTFMLTAPGGSGRTTKVEVKSTDSTGAESVPQIDVIR